MGVSKHPEEPKGRSRSSSWSAWVGAFFCHLSPALINRTGNVYHLLSPHRSVTLTFLDTMGGGKSRLCT